MDEFITHSFYHVFHSCDSLAAATIPAFSRTPACLLTDRHSHLQSSSHRSPDVLHLLDSLSLPFSLSLASTRACPPTDCPNDVTTASLPAPSETSSSFPTCFTRSTQASTVPTLAHPQVGVSTVRLSLVSFLSFHFPRSHWYFHFSACFFLVWCRPSSPYPNFFPCPSHTGLPTAPRLPTPAAVSPIAPPSPSVRISSLIKIEAAPLVSTPSRVTVLQATSPRRSPSHLTVVFC